MSTSGSTGPSRKRNSDQVGNYVSNENPQEGWVGTPGSSRVRVVESTSTHILERVWFFLLTLDLANADCCRSEVETTPSMWVLISTKYQPNLNTQQQTLTALLQDLVLKFFCFMSQSILNLNRHQRRTLGPQAQSLSLPEIVSSMVSAFSLYCTVSL